MTTSTHGSLRLPVNFLMWVSTENQKILLLPSTFRVDAACARALSFRFVLNLFVYFSLCDSQTLKIKYNLNSLNRTRMRELSTRDFQSQAQSVWNRSCLFLLSSPVSLLVFTFELLELWTGRQMLRENPLQTSVQRLLSAMITCYLLAETSKTYLLPF